MEIQYVLAISKDPKCIILSRVDKKMICFCRQQSDKFWNSFQRQKYNVNQTEDAWNRLSFVRGQPENAKIFLHQRTSTQCSSVESTEFGVGTKNIGLFGWPPRAPDGIRVAVRIGSLHVPDPDQLWQIWTRFNPWSFHTLQPFSFSWSGCPSQSPNR